MAKQNSNSKQGFTIIEVVLVLAIAGLIFLMVFVALPALQRSQRDTARRNDMSRVDTSLVQYQTNNSNKSNNLPTAGKWKGTSNFRDTNQCTATDTACKFARDYMNSGASEMEKENEFEDPNGTSYSILITSNWAPTKDGGDGTIGDGQFNENSKLESKDGGVSYTVGGNDPFSEYVVYIVPGGRCDGEYVKQSQKRHFAVLYRLEGAGVYCIDDQ